MAENLKRLVLLAALIVSAACSNTLAPTPTVTVTYTVNVSAGATADVQGDGVQLTTIGSGVWVRSIDLSVYANLALSVTPHNGCAVVMWHVAGGRDYGYVKCS